MKENYKDMRASDLCYLFVEIIQGNGMDPRLDGIKEALAKYDICVEFPEDEIVEMGSDKTEEHKIYLATILFKKRNVIVKEIKNVTIKLKNKAVAEENKKLNSEDIKFLKSIKISPWENS